MKVAILGSRGIPNRYGGFEQFAEYLSVGLVERGFEVWVYCSHLHPFREPVFHGVNLIHCRDPEDRLGTPGQFLYDLHCIIDSRRRHFDVILQLGYTSSSIWHRLLPRRARIVTNMDGLEWKRSKYPAPVQRFLRYAERLAVVSSDTLVADSEAIQQYLAGSYRVPSVFIPYGAEVCGEQGTGRIATMGLESRRYFLVIARIQPDNHVEEAIRGVLGSGSPLPLLVVGSTQNGHGRFLREHYNDPRIRFMEGIFDQELLTELRYHCRLYFHGHSAGGTNPSLLEAMANSAPVCAHDNPFNRSVLGEDARWFSSAADVAALIQNDPGDGWWRVAVDHNLEKILTRYTWKGVIEGYEEEFRRSLGGV